METLVDGFLSPDSKLQSPISADWKGIASCCKMRVDQLVALGHIPYATSPMRHGKYIMVIVL